jgi:GDPmannose 4,6-dehydratase
MKSALITGIGGQDGAYLAAHLLGEGYRVVGTSRDAASGRFDGLRVLGIRDRVSIRSMSLVDFRSTIKALA